MRIDHGSREIVCKVVYCGPGLSGKTTNLQFIHDRAPRQAVGEMVSIDTESERTLHFDLLPLDLGTVQGYRCRFEFYTVPGQTYYGATRRMVLEGTDGVVFVADSRRDMLDENVDSLNDLFENLHHHGLPGDLPMVVQYNKQDLPDALSPDQLNPLLNPRNVPDFTAVATSGNGVLETMKRITQLVIDRISQEQDLEATTDPAADAATGTWIITCHNCQSLLEVPHAAVGDVYSCGSCGAPLEVVDPDRGLTRQPRNQQTARQQPTSQKRTAGPPIEDETGLQMQSLPERSATRSSALSTAQSESGGHQVLPKEPFLLDGYQAVARLDENLLGQRYRIRDTATSKFERAIVINPAVLRQPGFRESLEPALSLANQSQSPTLLPVRGMRTKGDQVVVLYADAPDHEPLGHVLARRRVLQPAQAISIIQQIAIGLDVAARRGAVHGWLRPDVVLLNPEGNVLVDEMGIPKPHAYLVRESMGASAATEHYLAPEHLLNDTPSDIRTDMFFLGALLFRMLTGEGLVTGYSAHEALHKVTASGCRSVRSINAEVPRDLDTFCSCLTAIERRDRFQSYQELIQALTSLSIHRHNPTLKLTRGVPQPRRTRSGTGPISAGQRRSGTGPISAGQRRSGTGPISSSHRRSGTGGHRRTSGGTGPITSGSGPLAHGSRTRPSGSHHDTHTRHRKQGGGAMPVIMILLVVVVIGAVAFVIYHNKQMGATTPITPTVDRTPPQDDPGAQPPTTTRQEAPSDPTPDPDRPADESVTTTDPTPTPDSGPTPPATNENVVTKAQRLIDAYRTNAHDEQRLAAAKAALEAVREVDRQQWNRLRIVLTTALPVDTELEATPPVATERLAEADIQRLEGLIAEERFGAATRLLDDLGVADRARRGWDADIAKRHAEARDRLTRQALASGNAAQAEALIAEAVALWEMPKDAEWGEAVLINVRSGGGEAEQTPDAPIVAPSDDGGERLHSPAGFLIEALRIDRRIDDALAATDTRAVERLLGQLPEDGDATAAIRHKVQLWGLRDQILNQVIADRAPTLRVVPPVGQQPWDVLSADAEALQIKQPGGGQMKLTWSQVRRPQLGDLFAAAANADDARPVELALAGAANLIGGKPGPAALYINRARKAGYEHSADLQRLLEMARERQVIELFDEAEAALAAKDPQRITAVIAELEKTGRTDNPIIAARIERLQAAREKLTAGQPVGPVEAGSDALTFDNTEDRNAFPEREGVWAVSGGAIRNQGPASLARSDLGNATAIEVAFMAEGATGAVTVNFRGTRLTADFGTGTLLLTARSGQRMDPFDFALLPNTEYNLYMELEESGEVQVQLNQADPWIIDGGQPTNQLRISVDTGATARIEEVQILRGEARIGGIPRATDAQQEILRQNGWEPLGGAFWDQGINAIVLPPGGELPAGLGIPLRDGVRGYSFSLNGNGSMKIGVGYVDDGQAYGQSYEIPLAPIGDPPQEVQVMRTETHFVVEVRQPGVEPLNVELPLPERSEHVFVTVDGNARFATTPKTLR